MPYHFLGALITPLNLETKPAISWLEFKQLLEQNFIGAHVRQLSFLLRYFDLENLQLYWSKQPVTPYGNWTFEHLEQVQVEWDLLEPWLAELVHAQHNKNFATQTVEMMAQFFSHETQKQGASAQVLMRFWQSMWIIAFVRAKMQNRLNELKQEPGAEHSVICALLDELCAGNLNADAGNLRQILEDQTLESSELAKRALKWQLQFLEEHLQGGQFSLQRLLTYLLQLALVEQWQARTPQQNRMHLRVSPAQLKIISQKGN